MKNILKLYKYISDERNRLIATALVSAALSAATLATPLFFRYVIDQLTALASGHSQSQVTTRIAWVLGLLVLVQLAGSLFEFIRQRLGDRMTADLMTKLDQRIFDHMMTLSIEYYERTRVGETMTRVNFAVFEFTNWLTGLAQGTLSQIIQLVLATVLLWYISPLIGPVVMVLVAVGVAIQVLRIRKSRPIRREARHQYELAGGHLNETITHMATIRSAVESKVPLQKYAEILEKARVLTYRQTNVEQYGYLARSIVNDLAIVAGIAIVAWQALKGSATTGDVVAVALYLQQITGAIGPLGRLIVNTSQVETSVERIIEVLETKPTVVDAPDAVELDALREVEFRRVSFSYPGKKRKVLSDISFKLEADQTLALVGPSGTGKTTITKLMLRFYEPTSGEILINGRPIEHYTQESLRRHIGMVMQDVALFNDSVAANLRLVRPEATDNEVESAARQAHADIFIEALPAKLNTIVGERGVRLSGGEKQRMAIARAILKNPDLIVLDEATSALDSESERHVQAGLRDLMRGRTAIVIAHRLSTVMSADQILVMKGGRIMERGRHTELAEAEGGLYARLFKLQTEGLARL